MATLTIAQLMAVLTADTAGLDRGLQQAEASLKRTQAQAEKSAAAISAAMSGAAAGNSDPAAAAGQKAANDYLTTQSKMSMMNAALASSLSKVTSALMDTAMAITAVSGVSAKMSGDFNHMTQSLANNTLMGATGLKDMRTAVAELSKETGAPFEDLAKGYMHIANFGFQGAQATQVLTWATKEAVATGANATDVADALASSLHMFGKGAESAAGFMDVLHHSAAAGNMTIQEFVSAAGPALSMAANFKIPFDQAAASVSALSRAGFDASQASTQVKNIISHIDQPAAKTTKIIEALTKMTGVNLVHDFTASGLASKGLIGIFQDLMKATGGNADIIAELIPSLRGGTGAIALLNNASKDYNETLKANHELLAKNNGAETQGVYNAMMQDTEQKWTKLVQTIKVEFLPIGNKALDIFNQFMPVIKNVSDVVLHLMETFQKLPKPFQEFVTAFGLLRGIDRILTMFTRFPGMASLVMGAIKNMRTAFLLLSESGLEIGGVIEALSGPIGWIIGAITLVAVAWIRDWGHIREVTANFINWMKPYLSMGIKAIVDDIKERFHVVTMVFIAFSDIAKWTWKEIKTNFLDPLVKGFSSVDWKKVWDEFVSVPKDAMNGFIKVFNLQPAVDKWNAFWGQVSDGWHVFRDTFLEELKSLGDSISNWWNNTPIGKYFAALSQRATNADNNLLGGGSKPTQVNPLTLGPSKNPSSVILRSTFGGSTPVTVEEGRKLGSMFGFTDIGGRASSGHQKNSDHYTGNALDFMTHGDTKKGQQLADYAAAHAAEDHVKYVIWQQHIFNPSRAKEGWRMMPDRGSPTENHMDHVHISFLGDGQGQPATATGRRGVTKDQLDAYMANEKAQDKAAKAADKAAKALSGRYDDEARDLRKIIDLKTQANNLDKVMFDLNDPNGSLHGIAGKRKLDILALAKEADTKQRKDKFTEIMQGLKDRAAVDLLPKDAQKAVSEAGGIKDWQELGKIGRPMADGFTQAQNAVIKLMKALDAKEALKSAKKSLEELRAQLRLVGDETKAAAIQAAGGLEEWKKLGDGTSAIQKQLINAQKYAQGVQDLYSMSQDYLNRSNQSSADPKTNVEQATKQINELLTRLHLSATDPAVKSFVDKILGYAKTTDSNSNYKAAEDAARALEFHNKQAQERASRVYDPGGDALRKWAQDNNELVKKLSSGNDLDKLNLRALEDDARKGGVLDATNQGLQTMYDNMDNIRKEALDLSTRSPFQKWLNQFKVFDQSMNSGKGGFKMPMGMDEKQMRQVYEFQQKYDLAVKAANGIGDALITAFSNAYEHGFKNFFISVEQGFSKMMLDLAMQMLQSQLMTLLNGVFSHALGGTNFLGSLIPGAGGSGSIAPSVPAPAKRAYGGPVDPGSAYWVGDGGEPELFTPNTPGNITPASKLGGSGENHYHVHIHVGSVDRPTVKRAASTAMEEAYKLGARIAARNR